MHFTQSEYRTYFDISKLLIYIKNNSLLFTKNMSDHLTNFIDGKCQDSTDNIFCANEDSHWKKNPTDLCVYLHQDRS